MKAGTKIRFIVQNLKSKKLFMTSMVIVIRKSIAIISRKSIIVKLIQKAHKSVHIFLIFVNEFPKEIKRKHKCNLNFFCKILNFVKSV